VQEPDATETWKLQGWFQLQSDALGNHSRGKSRRAEHCKPVGQVLLRMMLQGSPAGAGHSSAYQLNLTRFWSLKYCYLC
jgi:hypothetical protein